MFFLECLGVGIGFGVLIFFLSIFEALLVEVLKNKQ